MAIGGVSTHLTSLVLWAVLPSVLTDFVLRGFYTLSPQHRPTLPPNATPDQVARENGRAQEHHRRARIALILGYLIYTLGSVYLEQASGPSQNYYALLGITRDQVEAGGPSFVKSHFRKLARVLHPDKVGKEGEPLFIAIKQGALTLENEGGLRWAYERFGPSILAWQPKPVTQRDFLVRGAQSTVGFYVVALASILLLSFFRKSEKAQNFWRYVFLSLTLSLEFHLILRTNLGSSFSHPILSLLLPNRLPYQQIELLRQLFISSSMAISHLAPLISASAMREATEGISIEERLAARAYADAEALRPLLQGLTNVVGLLEKESRLTQLSELRPLVGDKMTDDQLEGVLEDVRDKAEVVIRNMKVKVGEGTREAWKEAVQRGLERERKRMGVEAEVARPPVKDTEVAATPIKAEKVDLAPISAKLAHSNGDASHASPAPAPLVTTNRGVASISTRRIDKPSSAEDGEDEAAIIARARLLSPPPE